MKPLTRILAILLALAMLASCTPATNTAPSQGSGSLQSSDPDDPGHQPPERLTSEPAASADADAAPSPAPSAGDSDLLKQEIEFREERDLLICERWLLDDETRSPLARGTFFYLDGSVRNTDTHAGALLLATDESDTQHILRVSTPVDADELLLEHLAHTDENGEWRSGENGSGCDAETAAEIISAICTSADPTAVSYSTYHLPISDMTFNPDSGVVLAMSGYETFLVYIEGARPDAADYAEPIQLFYTYELVGFTSGQPVGQGIGLLAYNEGYGWSTLEG